MILAIVFFWYINFQGSPPSSHYLSAGGVANLEPQETSEKQKVLQLFHEINAHNKLLRTMKTDVAIDIVDSPFNLRGSIAYEKDLNFRMLANSITGRELDVGSTNNIFWFWSRRMKPPALYYSEHASLHKTRLKTPFHPLWMIECLNVGVIELPDKIKRNEKYILVEERKVSASTGNWVKKITLIDAEKKAIIGHYLLDLSDNGIASSEVLSFQSVNGFLVPKEMKICWYEENKTLYWSFSNTSVNLVVDPNNWVMPYMKDTVNMAEN